MNLIPYELLRLIATYLLRVEDQNKDIFQFPRDWRNFMNSRKAYFAKWKKESQLIILGSPLVEKFYTSLAVRERVLQYVENPQRQLELCFECDDERMVIDLKLIDYVKRISVSDSKVIPHSTMVQEIELKNCRVKATSLPTFGKVHTLFFRPEESKEVFDLSIFKNLQKGTFYLKHCINYHCLADLKELVISSCPSITDVSCFRNIPKLKLIACANLSDVSSLGNCVELDLSYNDGITDVAALGSVHTLYLTGCDNLEDISSLQNVHTLEISGCSGICDISGLRSVVSLSACSCYNLEALPTLPFLKELNIMGWAGICDLSGFGSLKKLTVDSTNVFHSSNFPIIAQLLELSIEGSLAFSTDQDRSGEQTMSIFDSENVQCLEHIPTLKTFSSVHLVEFPSLQFLRFLFLSGCDEFISLPLLSSLGYLEISFCSKLETLDILGTPNLKYPIYELKINNCTALRQASFHRKISRCIIAHCEELEILEVFSPIDFFKINQCTKLQKIVNKAFLVYINIDDEIYFHDFESPGIAFKDDGEDDVDDIDEEAEYIIEETSTSVLHKPRTCLLHFLPPEILRYLANYFLEKEHHDKNVFKFSHDWRNFMNTKKDSFGKWKKESQLIILSSSLTKEFYESAEVRSQVFLYVENPREQIVLHCSPSDHSIASEIIVNVKRLYFYKMNFPTTSTPLQVDSLDLVDCRIGNDSLSLFSRVKNLSMREDNNVEEIFDFSQLKYLETAAFQIRNCINYNSLANLKSLEIISCLSITDVSCFRNIPRLKLLNCPNIMNISSLATVYELDLSYNDKLMDVSALNSVHKLTLSYCNNLVDVSYLQNVHILDISGCFRVTDVSGLKSVEDLNISDCFDIPDIKPLTTLRKLNIKDCDKINDLSTLINLKKLELNGRRSLSPSSFTIVQKLSELTVVEDSFILLPPGGIRFISVDAQSLLSATQFYMLLNIPVLSIYHCSLPFQIPSFQSLRSLTICGCPNFSDLPVLPSLGSLKISYCEELCYLYIYGEPELQYSIYDVQIHGCPELTYISFQRKIFRCEITDCESLETIEVLDQIDLLKVDGCLNLEKINNESLIVCIDFNKKSRLYNNEGKEILFH
jgi:hypothetical protein